MGETIILSLLLLTKKALDSALEKGIAVAVAARRRDRKYEVKYRVTNWDNKCDVCLGDTDEKEKGKG